MVCSKKIDIYADFIFKNRWKKFVSIFRPPYISLNLFLLVLWRFKCNAYHLQAYMPCSRICSVSICIAGLATLKSKRDFYRGCQIRIGKFIFNWTLPIYISWGHRFIYDLHLCKRPIASYNNDLPAMVDLFVLLINW